MIAPELEEDENEVFIFFAFQFSRTHMQSGVIWGKIVENYFRPVKPGDFDDWEGKCLKEVTRKDDGKGDSSHGWTRIGEARISLIVRFRGGLSRQAVMVEWRASGVPAGERWIVESLRVEGGGPAGWVQQGAESVRLASK